jgi:hypothetical protein
MQGANVQKDVWTAGVVGDETKAAIGIPHFQFPGGHLFPWPSAPAQAEVID